MGTRQPVDHEWNSTQGRRLQWKRPFLANPFLANPFLANMCVLVVSQSVRPGRVGAPKGGGPETQHATRNTRHNTHTQHTHTTHTQHTHTTHTAHTQDTHHTHHTHNTLILAKNGLAKNGLAKKCHWPKMAKTLNTNFGQNWFWPKLDGKTRWPKTDWPKLDWPKSVTGVCSCSGVNEFPKRSTGRSGLRQSWTIWVAESGQCLWKVASRDW